MFKKNMNTIDRVARVFLSVALIYLGFIENGWITSSFVPVVLGMFGIANLLAAISGFCPVYILANFNFCKENKKI